jgi:hypothetical protein
MKRRNLIRDRLKEQQEQRVKSNFRRQHTKRRNTMAIQENKN